MTRTTVCAGPDAPLDNEEAGPARSRETALEMALVTASQYRESPSACVGTKEETEESCGSAHSSCYGQIEDSVKCDLIIKYNKKVKVIRRVIKEVEDGSEQRDRTELFKDETVI